MTPAQPDPAPSLEDVLRCGLDVVFVGINPSIYSAERGHYFARATNRFWPCLSRSTLSQAARAGLGVERLGPQHDADLPEYGIGFTDVVKRLTTRAAHVAPAELVAGVERLVAKLDRYQPRIACFHGVTGYRPVHQVLTGDRGVIRLGPQDVRVGATRLYLVPNPSGANAHYTLGEQTRWYDRLADALTHLPAAANSAVTTTLQSARLG